MCCRKIDFKVPFDCLIDCTDISRKLAIFSEKQAETPKFLSQNVFKRVVESSKVITVNDRYVHSGI